MSSCNSIDKLQKDLEDKEQAYLKAYEENQKLHSELIEERSTSNRSYRGSVMVSSPNAEMFSGYAQKKYYDDQSPKKNNIDIGEESSKLKVTQLEKQIEHLQKEKDKLEQDVLQRKLEIQEMKQLFQTQSSENKQKVRELEYKIEILQNEQDDNLRKVQDQVEKNERLKDEFISQKEIEFEQKIKKIEEEQEGVQTKLKKEIKELMAEGNRRTDEFLKQGVEIDELKDKIIGLKEQQVKMQNNND